MYYTLLSNRYLTSRMIPYIAVAAVGLCVALVIVVVSVMTGFLNMVKTAGQTMMGDVVISHPVVGIPHYEELRKRIEALPGVAGTTPVVESWGLLKMPYPDGPDKDVRIVQVWGVDPDSFGDVVDFDAMLKWPEVPAWDPQQTDLLHGEMLDEAIYRVRDAVLPTLTAAQRDELMALPANRHVAEEYRRILTEAQWSAIVSADPRLDDPDLVRQDGLALERNGDPAIVLGLHVSQANARTETGGYEIARSGYWWSPLHEVTLTTMPISRDGGVDTSKSYIFPIANEFASGVFAVDEKRVIIPLSVGQELLGMTAGEQVSDTEFGPDGLPRVLGETSARASLILVRGEPGSNPDQLRDAIEGVYEQFYYDFAARLDPPEPIGLGVSVQTWEQQQADFIGPVEQERQLMRTLFWCIYLVCAGLVLSIFWAIVYEKTRDIGIMRSFGASRLGVSWIFVRYGFVVGVLGAIVGLVLGWLIVRYINDIHTLLSNPKLATVLTLGALAAVAVGVTIWKATTGRLLPVVVGVLVATGLLALTAGAIFLLYNPFMIWNPRVYYFDTIPNEIDLPNAIGAMIGAVIFSLIGALVPAAKAADTDPVKALRYE